MEVKQYGSCYFVWAQLAQTSHLEKLLWLITLSAGKYTGTWECDRLQWSKQFQILCYHCTGDKHSLFMKSHFVLFSISFMDMKDMTWSISIFWLFMKSIEDLSGDQNIVYTHFSDTVDYEAHYLWVLEWGEEFGFQSVNLHHRVVQIFDSLIKWLHLELADFTWSCSLQSGACLSHLTLLWHCSGLHLWLVPRRCP